MCEFGKLSLFPRSPILKKITNYSSGIFLEGGGVSELKIISQTHTHVNLQNMYQGALRLICSMVECVGSEYHFP